MINDIYFKVMSRSKKLKLSVHEVHAAGPILVEWGVDISCSIGHPRTCTWLKPQMGYWALNCDGAMDDNRVRYGGLFRDDNGMPSFAYIGPRDKRHVLWVELQAIYRAVSLALLHGWYNLRIMSDSKLVVDILNKSIICPWRVVTIVHNIWEIMGCLHHVEMVHVWNETNQPADILASMDAGTSEFILIPCSFPLNLIVAISNDANGCTYNRL